MSHPKLLWKGDWFWRKTFWLLCGCINSNLYLCLCFWLIAEKSLLAIVPAPIPLYICICICICICACICICICVCISDWLRRKTCWLLRPHQDQSRVAPPAKSWKPRSLSTAEIRHQQHCCRARRRTRRHLCKTRFSLGRTSSPHLHGRRHLRLDGELHQLDLTLLALVSVSASRRAVALASPGCRLWLRVGQRQRGAGRTQDMFGCCSNCPRRSRSCRRRPAVLRTPPIASPTSCSCFYFLGELELLLILLHIECWCHQVTYSASSGFDKLDVLLSLSTCQYVTARNQLGISSWVF